MGQIELKKPAPDSLSTGRLSCRTQIQQNRKYEASAIQLLDIVPITTALRTSQVEWRDSVLNIGLPWNISSGDHRFSIGQPGVSISFIQTGDLGYEVYMAYTGEISVTLDRDRQRMSGTFFFTAKDQREKDYDFTNGEFDIEGIEEAR